MFPHPGTPNHRCTDFCFPNKNPRISAVPPPWDHNFISCAQNPVCRKTRQRRYSPVAKAILASTPRLLSFSDSFHVIAAPRASRRTLLRTFPYCPLSNGRRNFRLNLRVHRRSRPPARTRGSSKSEQPVLQTDVSFATETVTRTISAVLAIRVQSLLCLEATMKISSVMYRFRLCLPPRIFAGLQNVITTKPERCMLSRWGRNTKIQRHQTPIVPSLRHVAPPVT